MAVKIKLKRFGSIRNAQYRIVIANARTARDGRAIEEIGLYHPKEEPSLIKIDSARAQYWLGVGAQPTEPVMVLLKITGDWQKYKGLPGQEGTLRVAPVKEDKNSKFAATVLAVANEPRTPTIRPKVEPKVEVAPEPVAQAAPAEETPAVESLAEDSAAVETAEAVESVEAVEAAEPEAAEPEAIATEETAAQETPAEEA